jgi:LPS-assembly lipoprotein
MSSSERALRTGARAFAVALLALALGACGFHLRGDATYPFKTIFVSVPSSPSLAAELTRAITGGSGATVVESPAAAEVVLAVPFVTDDKDVLSLSSGGSVREYQIVKRVQFRLHDRDGNDWMPAGEIVVRRAYTFNETQVLARDLQEQRLLREMQTDAVQQIMRRIQTAKRPA